MVIFQPSLVVRPCDSPVLEILPPVWDLEFTDRLERRFCLVNGRIPRTNHTVKLSRELPQRLDLVRPVWKQQCNTEFNG